MGYTYKCVALSLSNTSHALAGVTLLVPTASTDLLDGHLTVSAQRWVLGAV